MPARWNVVAAVVGLLLLATSCGSSKHAASSGSTTLATSTTLMTTSVTSSVSTTNAPTTSVPTSTATTIGVTGQISAFVGTWGSHFGAFTIRADGTGNGSWRVYKWCSDDPTPPCDAQVNNNIIDGGNADVRITTVNGNQAFATVLHTTDAKTLPKGDIVITLVAGDQLQVGSLGPFCGPHAAENACGA